ncbi:ABC transporter permease [Tabrizicola sp.]|jgi:spermidine/putrescine transport system permease protein|uniref:ABC transporter permease n=1 Tax=Tabrizicola sp. TaxID=2005166 RepID=UPI003D293859
MAGGIAPVSSSSDGSYSRARLPLLLPTWAVIGIFMLVPVLLMVVYSFLTKEFRGGVQWTFTWAAYDQFFITRGLFGDEPAQIEWTYITIFWRSIWQAGLATALCLLIGFPTAWFIATRPERSRPIWLFLITIPYWVNLLIRTVSLRFILRDQGPLNGFLIEFGLLDQPLAILNTNFAVQLGLFYSYLPFMVLPIYAAVERYNFAYSEAAADLYASRWVTLREVVLPIVRPGVVAGCILVFVPALGAFLAPDLLGGAKNFMIGSLIDEQFRGSQGNWPFGAAISVILMSLVLIVLMGYARMAAREAKP